MSDAIEFVQNWRFVLAALIVFGVAPGIVLRVIVLAYPRGHVRRKELLAELYGMPPHSRPIWVAQQFETALFEGPPARLRARRAVRRSSTVIVSSRGVDVLYIPLPGPPVAARLGILLVVLGLGFGGIVWRLVSVQAIASDSYATVGMSQRLRVSVLPASRGVITDRYGVALAVPTRRHTVWADPLLVNDPLATARVLSPILGMDVRTLQDRLTEGSQFVYLARQVDDSIADNVSRSWLDGVYVQEVAARFYPYGTLASPVVGITGVDDEGLSGFELQYNAPLTGRDGEILAERDPAGRVIKGGTHHVRPAANGQGMVSTLDVNVQRFAEDALRQQILAHGATSGVVVVSDPRSGAILAMASLVAGKGDERPEPPNYNKAVGDLYEFDSFRDALGHASTAAPQALSALYQDLGFGRPTNLSLPDERAGTLPSADQPLAANAVQILFALNAIANGGQYVGPSLVSEMVDADGTKRAVQPAPRRRVLSEADARVAMENLADATYPSVGGRRGVADSDDITGSGTTGRMFVTNMAGARDSAYVSMFAGVGSGESGMSALVLLQSDRPYADLGSAASLFNMINEYSMQHVSPPPGPGIPEPGTSSLSSSRR